MVIKEARGVNLWDVHRQGHFVVVTTNGIRKANGEAVMGAGLAKQAAQRFSSLPKRLGELLRERGNHVYVFPDLKIITMPTKEHWRAPSPLWLIERSCKELARLQLPGPIYLPRPGCGLGGLSWGKQVRPLIEGLLDDRFIVVTPK